jgi:hypothetical protein
LIRPGSLEIDNGRRNHGRRTPPLTRRTAVSAVPLMLVLALSPVGCRGRNGGSSAIDTGFWAVVQTAVDKSVRAFPAFEYQRLDRDISEFAAVAVVPASGPAAYFAVSQDAARLSFASVDEWLKALGDRARDATNPRLISARVLIYAEPATDWGALRVKRMWEAGVWKISIAVAPIGLSKQHAVTTVDFYVCDPREQEKDNDGTLRGYYQFKIDWEAGRLRYFFGRRAYGSAPEFRDALLKAKAAGRFTPSVAWPDVADPVPLQSVLAWFDAYQGACFPLLQDLQGEEREEHVGSDGAPPPRVVFQFCPVSIPEIVPDFD